MVRVCSGARDKSVITGNISTPIYFVNIRFLSYNNTENMCCFVAGEEVYIAENIMLFLL